MAKRIRIGAGIAAAVALAACAGDEQGAAPGVRAGDVAIAARLEPEAPRVGANVLEIELAGASGVPLAGAQLAVRVDMPAMGAMPAMGGPASVHEHGGGRYRAEFELDMGGTWQVAIEATPPGGKPARLEGSLTTGVPGLRLAAVGGAPAQHSADAHAGHAEAAHPGEFQLDAGRVQRVGVRVAKAERRLLETPLRAVGRVVAEETTLADVALKVKGWVGSIQVNAVGIPVERGQVLFRVYSPELYGAQEELLQALASAQRARDGGAAPGRADELVRAARNRLRLWNVDPADVERLAARGEPLEHLPIRSPVSGYVVEKNVSQGSAFEPGQRLYRIAPLSRVWVEADVQEFELASVATGQRAEVSFTSLPGRRLEARVAYVQPTLDPSTRTGRVRLELPNPELVLRPAMTADVRLYVDRGERLLVPYGAVLYTGERSFVFRALGDGRFRPQEVTTGLRSGDAVEVLAGLEAGDAVVASGTFLIASESRLRAALELW
jgi:Cu(I)/Ag(I) efflux system membrane fusion protein